MLRGCGYNNKQIAEIVESSNSLNCEHTKMSSNKSQMCRKWCL